MEIFTNNSITVYLYALNESSKHQYIRNVKVIKFPIFIIYTSSIKVCFTQAITKSQFYEFLETAPNDPDYIVAKVIAIIGIHGLLQLNELDCVQWNLISLGTTSNKIHDGSTETINNVSIKVMRSKN